MKTTFLAVCYLKINIIKYKKERERQRERERKGGGGGGGGGRIEEMP